MDVRGKRVFVGLSGGVDSAVSAALLREAGADVTGVFIKGWYPPGMPCTWASERRDAMRVAARLQIPFHTLDASDAYKKGVIDYLLREYAAGRTPNPDIMCNREVKFGAFYSFAKNAGADRIATGHYARSEGGALYRGADPSKDQSYFLWAVPSGTIACTLFPLGGMQKEGVRAFARKRDLPVSGKKDSQGICFLGSISVDEFLRKEIGSAPGKALDEEGREVGVHDGAVLYTLGERIALADSVPGPWYVLRKDMEANRVTVAQGKPAAQKQGGIQLSETNWLSPHEDGAYAAQLRYHGPLVKGVLQADTFIPHDPLVEPAAPGQSLVVYDDDHVIGGGIIR